MAQGKTTDFTNEKVGRLTVIKRDGTDKHGRATWSCICDCGNHIIVASDYLKRKQVRSCGCIVSPNLSGKKFNRLTVIDKAYHPSGRQYWNCICDCGNKTIVRCDDITSGSVKSCGCLNNDNHAIVHGYNGTSTHWSWRAMKNRCNHSSYIYHHGRGVMYDPRWEKFENFLEDMGERPDGMTLERINNDWHYTPDNCRWATRKEQIANTCERGKGLNRPKLEPLYKSGQNVEVPENKEE